MRLTGRLRRLGALALFAGGASVAASGCGWIRDTRQTNSLVRIAKAEERAIHVYRIGANDEATRALMELARLLEREEADWTGTSHGRMLAADLSLTYGRLSRLSERVSAEGQDAQRYFALARRWYDRSGQPTRDDTALRELIIRVDQLGGRGEASR
jgi:hypothetical protein